MGRYASLYFDLGLLKDLAESDLSLYEGVAIRLVLNLFCCSHTSFYHCAAAFRGYRSAIAQHFISY